MKFYNRYSELDLLAQLDQQAGNTGIMTVLIGRRRVGKTMLALELISQGRISRGEIESILEKDVGGYLSRLEQDYAVITRHRPIHAKIHTRNQKYKIADYSCKNPYKKSKI